MQPTNRTCSACGSPNRLVAVYCARCGQSLSAHAAVAPIEPRVPAGRNPCRPGSRKHIVCDAALRGDTLTAVRRRLDEAERGAGARLNEYISDLRSENRLDIRIDGDRLVYRGRL